MKTISVGRSDGKLLKPPISGLNRAVRCRWFTSTEEATAFIDSIRKHDPEGVDKGRYYLDAPEDDATRREREPLNITELAMADYAEAWWRHKGNTVPPRETDEWLKIYEEWVAWVFAQLHDAPAKRRKPRR